MIAGGFTEKLRKIKLESERRSRERIEFEKIKEAEKERIEKFYFETKDKVIELIDSRIAQFGIQFPQFERTQQANEDGYAVGVACDEVMSKPDGFIENYFSKINFLVKPYAGYGSISIRCKTIVRNKERKDITWEEDLVGGHFDKIKEFIDQEFLIFVEM